MGSLSYLHYAMRNKSNNIFVNEGITLSQYRPHFFVLLGVLFISFSSIFVRLTEAPSLIIAFYRMLFTVMILMPILISDKTNRDEIVSIDRRTLFLSVLSGIFLAFHFYVFIASLDYTSVTSSTVLVTIHPVFVGLGSYFLLREKISAGFAKAVAVTFLGGVIISFGDAGNGDSALFGNLLAFMGALFITVYMLIGRIARQKMSVTSYTIIVYLSSTVTLFLVNLVVQEPFYPYQPKDWILILSMALICTIMGHNVLNWALKYFNPTFISSAILGEPVFATIWALLLFREYPGDLQLIGSAIVIMGLLMLIRKAERTTLS